MIFTTVVIAAFAALSSASKNPRTAHAVQERGAAINVFGSKRGQAYNDANLANTFHNSCQSCSWAYNWWQTPDGLDPSISYVPMLGNSAGFNTWSQNAAAAIASGSKAILSFNEPDIASQANMPVADAVNFHKQYMNPFAGQARIGAPAVSNSGDPNQGLGYLQQWINQCAGQCAFDFCPIHWYSDTQYQSTLIDQVNSAFSICEGKPIWVTEFAPTNASDDDKNSFMTNIIPQLESLDFIEAYSYFMTATGNIMQDATTPSIYGANYASQASTPVTGTPAAKKPSTKKTGKN